MNVQCKKVDKNIRLQKANEALNSIEETVQKIAKDGLNQFKESDKEFIPTITRRYITSDDIEKKKNIAIKIAVQCASQHKLDAIENIAKPNIFHYATK